MKALDLDIKFQQAGFTITWHQWGKLLGSISWLNANREAVGDQRSIKRLLWFSAAIIVCYCGSAILINMLIVVMCFCAMQLQCVDSTSCDD